MKKLVILSAAALLAVGSFQASEAEARDGRRTAAVVGAVGGFLAGAAIGSALSGPAYAAPGYAYAPAYGHRYAPPVSYGYAPAYTTHVVRTYEAPVCETHIRRRVNSWGEVVTTRREVCY